MKSVEQEIRDILHSCCEVRDFRLRLVMLVDALEAPASAPDTVPDSAPAVDSESDLGREYGVEA